MQSGEAGDSSAPRTLPLANTKEAVVPSVTLFQHAQGEDGRRLSSPSRRAREYTNRTCWKCGAALNENAEKTKDAGGEPAGITHSRDSRPSAPHSFCSVCEGLWGHFKRPRPGAAVDAETGERENAKNSFLGSATSPSAQTRQSEEGVCFERSLPFSVPFLTLEERIGGEEEEASLR